mmetsp:Transcript_6134/g.9843  ORF Transcript_6134/g.9843 Transcript_6134/m.9843 type:complete len:133 (-) Transcript_6134:2776-3174(-)
MIDDKLSTGWKTISESHPFCNIESLKIAELKCPGFIKTIVYDSMLLNQPERVAKYINARAVHHNSTKAEEYKTSQGTQLLTAPPELLEDFFLSKITEPELKLLNEGRKIRKNFTQNIPNEGTRVTSDITLKI